ncbi:hypothetical protein LDENG_00034010 [Lucifuga dentata]|nr:hypothetical protein LDENG_00034010 [Lucifuga dentata]
MASFLYIYKNFDPGFQSLGAFASVNLPPSGVSCLPFIASAIFPREASGLCVPSASAVCFWPCERCEQEDRHSERRLSSDRKLLRLLH